MPLKTASLTPLRLTPDPSSILTAHGRFAGAEPDRCYTIQVTAKKGNKSVVAAHKVEVIEAPAVVSAWKLEDDLIGGKNARLTILNKSDKTINALRVRIVMWDNFGERVDFFSDYVFHGVASDTLLQPNAQRDYVWSLYWATGVSDIRAWVYEAAFTDGSVWRLAD